ncbi:MAG TPA: nuclear transport factor 2 family protein [Burkholderiales bacterium]|nr:nuclear transport factor 2 family protein [Burkholderiales bacterium]
MQEAGLKPAATQPSDLDTLKRLNLEYVRSVEQADPRWFESHLAPDFMNSNPDGSLVDRAAFLKQIARGAAVSDLEAQDVLIRVMGDLAVIHARTSHKTPAGKAGGGRYTDIWSRRDGRWVCVAAQVTRC